MVSFDEPLGFDEAGDTITLADVFDNTQDDPSTLAARNMDWEVFLAGQTRRGRTLLAVVAEGRALRDVARLLGLSDSSVQEEKRKVARAVKEFMGANILSESVKEPRWRDNIMAGRERQACRAARL
jgi:FixJ family two-component response regulator